MRICLFAFMVLFSAAYAAEGSCPKCVLIRKANEEKSKSQTWVFYEDWLETDEGKATKESEIKFDDDQATESDQEKE